MVIYGASSNVYINKRGFLVLLMVHLQIGFKDHANIATLFSRDVPQFGVEWKQYIRTEQELLM